MVGEPTDTTTSVEDEELESPVSFAETALRLGGKSDEEARRTGAIDTADDQVEQMFQPQYQTVNSPIHQAVWGRTLPVELFQASEVETEEDVQTVMDNSVELVRRHKEQGTLLDENKKVSEAMLDELGGVGYWGLLVDREHGGSGASFRSFAPFLTRMALVDGNIAGLASVHGCIGAVDPVRTFGSEEQKQRFLPGLASASLRGLLPRRPRQGDDGPPNEADELIAAVRKAKLSCLMIFCCSLLFLLKFVGFCYNRVFRLPDFVEVC